MRIALWIYRTLPIALAASLALTALETPQSLAADYVVYSVYKPLDLGGTAPEAAPKKDYYVNMGTAQGLHPGSSLEVIRRISTYDLLNQKLYQDVTFPIARLKVIHVESGAAICRLDKFLPADKTPEPGIRAVMVGDAVRVAQ
jgi:hypothetical protein